MNTLNSNRVFSLIGIFFAGGISACNPGGILGNSGDNGPAQFTPDYTLSPPAHQAALPCGDNDASHLCIALKYAPYENGAGQATVSKNQALANVVAVNSVWAQCQVKFFVENYVPVNPASAGLAFASTSMDDLQAARDALADANSMLVVTTGQWTGELGSQAANAWTNLPPVGPFGVVLEQSVATYSNITAHELGHYMNLVHVADSYNVMNPIVYANSINITDDQCKEARATAISFWGAMLR